jgi:AraC-like DNA-binding protein
MPSPAQHLRIHRGTPGGHVSTSFSTRSVDAPRQLEFWRESIGEVYVPLEVNALAPGGGGFDGTIVRHMDRGLAYSEIFGDAHVAMRTQRLAKHCEEDVFLVLVQRSGQTLIEQDGRQTVLREGEFALCDSNRSCTLTMPQRFHHDTLMIEGRTLRTALREPDRFTARAMRGDTGPGRIFLSMFGALRETIGELDECTGACVSDSLVSMLGAAVATLQGETERLPHSNLEMYHRERVRTLTNERLFDPDLSVESIAEEVKLSSRYVYRLFEREPETLSTWIWRKRLEAARRAILSPSQCRRSITDIAYSVGFKDPAHFSRQFKATYGCSPREFRASLTERESAAT